MTNASQRSSGDSTKGVSSGSVSPTWHMYRPMSHLNRLAPDSNAI